MPVLPLVGSMRILFSRQQHIKVKRKEDLSAQKVHQSNVYFIMLALHITIILLEQSPVGKFFGSKTIAKVSHVFHYGQSILSNHFLDKDLTRSQCF